jgi:hypothetical protein
MYAMFGYLVFIDIADLIFSNGFRSAAVVTVQYQVLRENVFEAFYALTNPAQQIT